MCTCLTNLRFVHFAERDSEIQSNYHIFPSLLRPYSNDKKQHLNVNNLETKKALVKSPARHYTILWETEHILTIQVNIPQTRENGECDGNDICDREERNHILCVCLKFHLP